MRLNWLCFSVIEDETGNKAEKPERKKWREQDRKGPQGSKPPGSEPVPAANSNPHAAVSAPRRCACSLSACAVPGELLTLDCSGQAHPLPSSHCQLHTQGSMGFTGQETTQIQLAHPGEHCLHMTSVVPRVPSPLLLYLYGQLTTRRPHFPEFLVPMGHVLRPPCSYQSVPLPTTCGKQKGLGTGHDLVFGPMAHRNPRPSRGWLCPLLESVPCQLGGGQHGVPTEAGGG